MNQGAFFWKSSYYKGQDKKAHLIIIPQFENEQNEFTKALSTFVSFIEDR